MANTISIKGKIIELDDPEIQNILQRTYVEKLRPLCMCKSPGIAMYIAKIGSMFYVKRMPDSGADHAANCTSYDPPPELSGLGEVLGSAIKEDIESGLVALRFDFALTKSSRRVAPSSSDVENDSVKIDSTKLTIRALLHYLWDRSKLTHWQPNWHGKRNWGTIYKQLTSAAHGNQTKGMSLTDCLYVPVPFFVDRKDEIAGQRSVFMNHLAQSDSKARRLGIVIGEVKAIENARYGHKIVFKQVPDFHFMLNEDAHKRIHKRFENELALWGAFEGTHLMAIATFGIGQAGLANIEEIALMLTTENWIPFADLNEKNLIDRLIQSNRSFIKGMRYNMSSKRALASIELIDTAPAPTAMFVIPADTDEVYKQDISELTDKSQLMHWIWKSGTAMPAIPKNSNDDSS